MLTNLNSILERLRTDPAAFFLTLLYTIPVILLSLILHECAHGYVAYRCGDDTAKMLGRLSLNPARHLDPMGTLCMLLFGFGWARPVPVNPRKFRHFLRDDLLVSLAGIVTNLCLFLICTSLSVLLGRIMLGSKLITLMSVDEQFLEIMLNPYSGYYYDMSFFTGSAMHIYNGTMPLETLSSFSVPWLTYVVRFLMMMGTTNLALAVFNFLPILPLDGYHVVNDTILRGRIQLDAKAFGIMQLILIGLMFSGILDRLLSLINTTIYSGLVDLLLMIPWP